MNSRSPIRITYNQTCINNKSAASITKGGILDLLDELEVVREAATTRLFAEIEAKAPEYTPSSVLAEDLRIVEENIRGIIKILEDNYGET